MKILVGLVGASLWLLACSGSGTVMREAEVTSAPTSDAPVSDAPVSDAPVSDAPASDAPVSDAPVSDAPVSDAPAANTPPPSPTPGDLVELIVADMQGAHDSELAGVPSSYDWAAGPRLGLGNEPTPGWTAAIAWGQVYAAAGGNPAQNTAVEITDLRLYMLSKKDGQWHALQQSNQIEGEAFREDFSDDESVRPDVRTLPNGNLSVRLTEGFNFHFWPKSGRVTIDPADIAGMWSSFEARLTLHDPEGGDDRDQAKLLAGAGGDYWLDLTAAWDNFKTNNDFAIGKMKWVTQEWRRFNAHTMSEQQLRANPPTLD